MNMKNLALASILIMLFLGCFIPVNAEEKDARKIIGRSAKEIQGEVSWIGKDKIAVTYKRDDAKGGEYEILLSFDKNSVRLVHKKSLGEIKIGDVVRIEYDETKEDSKGTEKINYQVKTIGFVRPAAPKPVAPAEGEEEASLAIKGIKGE